MRYSPPTRPLSKAISSLAIRLYDALVQRGVPVRMACSKSQHGYFLTSRSTYLHIHGGKAIIRISDHIARSDLHSDLDIVVQQLVDLPRQEQQALDWIEANYGSTQNQTAAA